MSLTCSISGETPLSAVVNRVSGYVYEKNLIEKYVKEHKKDPKTGQVCDVEDIISLNISSITRPRVSTSTSLPGIIKLLQEEYDSLALELFTVRKQLETCRQELSHSLYQHDAACRVIARLTKERDEARNALASVTSSHSFIGNERGTNDFNTSVEKKNVHLFEECIAEITSCSEVLQSQRKEKKKPLDLATRDQISTYKEKSNFHAMHSTSTPGILCMAVHSKDENLVLTGGLDKKAVLYDIQKDTVVKTFTVYFILNITIGHSKKVTAVQLHPNSNLALTGSSDFMLRVFSTTNEKQFFSLNSHNAGITSMSLHPKDHYLTSSDQAGKWGFHNIEKQLTYQMCSDPNNSSINCANIHPDGILYGNGMADSMVRIWDLRNLKPVVLFEGHKGSVNGISFSENGYILATSGEDNTIRLWDLRKCSPYKTIKIEDHSFQLACISFDSTGTYFAAGGENDIIVYLTRQVSEIVTLHGHNKEITGIHFNSLSNSIVSCSKDRSVRVWG